MDNSKLDNESRLSQEYDKAIRLFTYLKDICALRSFQVRNVSSYDEVFWFSDIPQHKLCRCLMWGLVDQLPQTSVQQSNIWIEIRKPALKSPPELPDELEPWIKDEELADSSLNEPGFYEKIPLADFQGNSEDTDPNEFVSINDHEHIFEKLMDYIETKWKPWAAEDRELQRVQRAYNQLFNIYQRQEKLGEQYEVVIGAGLLLWSSPNSGEIRRHVLTVQTRIDFDRIKGIMSVGPALDGPNPILEYNMLETDDRPNPTILTKIEEDAAALDGDPWVEANLRNVFKGFVNSLPVTGDYMPSLEHKGGLSNRPSIRIAPALILRRRTHRTFEDFYRQIIEQIKEGEKIPENVRRIIEIVDDIPEEKDVNTETKNTFSSYTLPDNELYFPLPANDEQKRIAKIIEHRRGILVQGPPGTGKSHTICNLIAHFLARGKKILVTSETPRALEVLRHKLHNDMPEIEELCVVWIGSGPESQRALEKSVLGITQKKANWNISRDNDLIDSYSMLLDEARKEQARLRHELRAHRELDVYHHSSVFGRYTGTLEKIAQQVNQEREQFNWFIDNPDKDANPLVTSEELLRMLHVHMEHTVEITSQLKYNLFPLEQLILPGEFNVLVDKELKAIHAHREAQENRNYPGYAQLTALGRSTRNTIKTIMKSILATQDALAKHYHPWAERVSREISGDQERTWSLILNKTCTLVEEIETLSKKYQPLEVTGLAVYDLKVAERHARALKGHLDAGRSLGFLFFRNQIVKDGLYLVNDVKVNGAACNNTTTLDQLLTWISIMTKIAELGDLWKSITTSPSGNIAIQCSTYRDMCEPIEQALTIHDQIEEVRKLCLDCPGIHLPAWHSQQEVKSFGNAIDAANLEEDLELAKKTFSQLIESIVGFINRGNSHCSVEEILRAVNERNSKLYSNMYNALEVLHKQAKADKDANHVFSYFQECAPKTCKDYKESYSKTVWEDRFLKFHEAWIWAKMDKWLMEVCDKGYTKKIQYMLESAASKERQALKHLAALKAWRHCLTNLREKERSALIAWSLAVAKIRSGKGKYVETYREIARQRLDECRGAIPGWVMPMYQVVQTIRPRKQQFDIAIIDEASQSGPEALLLNYIADKLIVVGDEKQITPMHVGVNREHVLYLSRKHLHDIPYKEALDLEGSLFSQAELRFPDRIRLREHFRSMPEIIQFSNNLSYPTEPLIPLRQYGAHRLEPLQTKYVENGYRKGASEDVENYPEAEAIVAQIADCCEDPAYEGKTFGVISLMGGARQVELINRLLLGKDGIGADEIEKRRLVCGRPYDFQGDERDIIFLSMVDAPQDGHLCRMIRDADTQRRFNVAASRARDQLWLFHSATLNDLRPECLRYKLLDHCLNPKVLQPDPIGETTITELRRMSLDKSLRVKKPRELDSSLPFDSWFEVDVFFKIIDRGYRVLPQYEIRNYGYRIDLVVEGLKGRLAVECDGDAWHGPETYEYDMTRERNLVRCGWVFYRVRGTDFYRDPDESLAELWETLERLKITPWQNWESDKKKSERDYTPIEDVVAEHSSDEQHEELEQDTEIDEEEPTEDGVYHQDRAVDRLDRALEYARKLTRKPENTSSQTIQSAIISSLNKCPNQSCTIKSLTSRVLKELGVLTRGNPRLEFEKRVMRNLGVLERKGDLKTYQAKNKRVRLINFETSLF